MAERGGTAEPVTTTAPTLVGVENLTVHFRQGGRQIDALKDFTLNLREGEFVSLVGPSGCGKSTLLRVIAGLHKDFSGRLDIDPQLRRTSLGFVFQRDALLPWKTMLANVATGLQIRGVGRRERTERARDLLHRVGLSGFEDAYPSQLSGGMRQRASVARTLIYEPRVILMDEPFGALDAQVKGQIQELFLSIWEDIRPSVVFVTHDLAEAIYLAERVVVLSGRPGRVRTELPVDLPRPRTSPFEIWRDEHYLSIHGELWESLKTEIGPS